MSGYPGWRDWKPDSSAALRVRVDSAGVLPLVKPSKYHAVKTTIDGQRFDSKGEAQWFQGLRLRERAGDISQLEAHPTFALHAFSQRLGQLVRVATFTPDARYVETASGEVIIADLKSPATRKETSYRLRKRWFEAEYGFTLLEVLA